MTVTNIGMSQLAGHAAKQRPTLDWAQLQVGHNLTLRVLNQIGQGRYTATAGGERHVVESHVDLNVGSTIRARVTAVGDKVELKYLGPEGSSEAIRAGDAQSADTSDPAVEISLGSLQEKYAVALTRGEQQTVSALSRGASQPQTMILGGLYLSKLGMPVNGAAMQALYAARVWQGEVLARGTMAHDVSALINAAEQGETQTLQRLAKLMGDAMDPTAVDRADDVGEESPASSLVAEADTTDRGGGNNLNHDSPDTHAMLALARRLLNTQDQGSVGYHFGTLPIIVANQLIELDLVLFREHTAAARTPGVKKLVMSLRTQTLGRVEIVAQSVDSRLSVFVRTDSTQASEALAAHGGEVKELMTRLGWGVDSVSYRMKPEPERAATTIIKHVLTAGTLDAVV